MANKKKIETDKAGAYIQIDCNDLAMELSKLCDNQLIPRLERIEQLLLGNGQEGLVVSVAKNTEFRLEMKKIKFLIWGAFLSGLGSLVITLIKIKLGF